MASSLLEHIRIVLVEPAGGLNVGAAARVMANMGLTQLVLVNPHCDPLGEEARQMAVHATALLTNATVVPTLPDALAGCVRAIATTARPRALNTPLELPEVALPWLVSIPEAETITALIFGPEDRGLSNDELKYAQRFVCIPSNPVYPSLNLAQAIALCCYELSRAAYPRAAPAPLPGPSAPSPTVSFEKLEGFFHHLESLLLNIGYLYSHTAASRMEKFRRLVLRAAPTHQELAMLRGILRQMEWALKQASQSSPVGDNLPSSQDETHG